MSVEKIYPIKAGDTLEKIALENGISVDQLRQANPGISNQALSKLQGSIRIPSSQSLNDLYIVQQGDTLSQIAKDNNITVNELLKSNSSITDPSKIKSGQNISLPGKNRVTKPTATSTNVAKTKVNLKQKNSTVQKLPVDKTQPCVNCVTACEVFFHCLHRDGRVPYIKGESYEVVALSEIKEEDVKKKKNKKQVGMKYDKILVAIKGNAPASISLDGKEKRTSYEDNGKIYEVSVPYDVGKEEKDSIGSFKELARELKMETVEYELDTKCAGIIPIKVYSPDIWKVAVKFPKWGGRKQGLRQLRNTAPDFIEHTKSKSTGWSGKEKQDVSHIDLHSDVETKKEGDWENQNQELGLVISRNGKKIEFINNGWITPIIEFGDMVNTISEYFALLREVCSVGWYLNLETSFFEGELSLEYKNKEDKNSHKVHSHLIVAGQMKFIGFKFEVGFGIRATSDVFAIVRLRIELELTGTIKHDDEVNGYEDVASGELKGGAGKISIGAEAQAGDFLAVGLLVETAVEARGTIEYHRNGGWKGTCEFEVFETKLVLAYKYGAGKKNIEAVPYDKKGGKGFYDDSKEWKVFDGKKFDLGKWPDDDKDEANFEFVERKELLKYIEDAFTDWINIRVFSILKDGRLGKEVESDTVYKNVADKIISRTDIKRDKKSVETMVQQINEALEKKRGDRKPKIGVYGYGTTKRLVIAEQEFNDFIHKGEMDEILDKYISQAIVINNQINAKKQQNKPVP